MESGTGRSRTSGCARAVRRRSAIGDCVARRCGNGSQTSLRFGAVGFYLLTLLFALPATVSALQGGAPDGAIIIPPDRVDDRSIRRAWADLLIEAQEPPEESVVVVTGQAQVEAEPDRARIYFAVETEGSTAREAGETNAAMITAVTAGVRAAAESTPGIRIETASYALEPRYGPARQDRPREILGYTARNTLQVRVDDVERVGALIDAALASGANRVSSLQFEIRDPEPFRAEALREAIRVARTEAGIMAESLGMALGPPLEVEGGADVPFPRPFFQADRAFAMVEAAPTPIEATLQTVSARVTIRFRLDPAQ